MKTGGCCYGNRVFWYGLFGYLAWVVSLLLWVALLVLPLVQLVLNLLSSMMPGGRITLLRIRFGFIGVVVTRWSRKCHDTGMSC